MFLKMAPKVSIIILNYNGKEDTLECLDSVSGLDYPNYEIIVVDNGSTDGSMEAVKSEFPRVSIIANKENLGFTGGNNIGIARALAAGAAYILLLNNDTAIDKPALRLLVEAMDKDAKMGLIGPAIFYWGSKERLWSSGTLIDWSRFVWARPASAGGGLDKAYEVDAISGCAMMFRAGALRECGLFDERFFLYGEDTDICLRIKQKGFGVFCLPRAMVWHKVGKTISGSDSPGYVYYTTRNRFYLVKKHASFWQWLFFLACDTYLQTANCVRFVFERRTDKVKAALKGIMDFFLGRFAPLKQPPRQQ